MEDGRLTLVDLLLPFGLFSACYGRIFHHLQFSLRHVEPPNRVRDLMFLLAVRLGEPRENPESGAEGYRCVVQIQIQN